MRGTSNSYVVSIHSSLLPVFQYHTSNLLAGSRPSVGRKGHPVRKGGHLSGFKVGSSKLQGHLEEGTEVQGTLGR